MSAREATELDRAEGLRLLTAYDSKAPHRMADDERIALCEWMFRNRHALMEVAGGDLSDDEVEGIRKHVADIKREWDFAMSTGTGHLTRVDIPLLLSFCATLLRRDKQREVKIESDLAKLQDREAILINMMRGTIAKVSARSLHKLYTEDELLEAARNAAGPHAPKGGAA